MKNLARSLALVALFATGCSMFAPEPEQPPLEDVVAAAQQAAQPQASTRSAVARTTESGTTATEGTSTVEVLWQVPADAVEKYHLYYGLEPDALENHIEVPVAELEKIDHPKHGPVYRYELKQIPASRAIYLSLRAENRYGMSDPSPATRVEAGQKTVTP